jgi:hypothetical protein
VAPQPLGLPTSLACSFVLFSRVANEIRDPIVSSGLKPQPVAVLPAGVTFRERATRVPLIAIASPPSQALRARMHTHTHERYVPHGRAYI